MKIWPDRWFSGALLKKGVLIPLLAAWGAALALGSLDLARQQVQAAQNRPSKMERFYSHYMGKGQQLLLVFRPDQAQAFFKQALEIAPNDRSRNQAALEYARAQLTMAKDQPLPHALLAKQYFSAVIEANEDPARVLEAYRGYIEASVLLNDMESLNRACGEALALATNSSDRVNALKHQMQVYLRVGSWTNMALLAPQVEPFLQEGPHRDEMEYEWTTAREQILLRPEWFREYADQQPDKNPEDLRRDLLKDLLEHFQALSESEDLMVRDESLFRIARLLCQEGMFHQAQYYIQVFLENEPSRHLDETLILLTRMARMDGEMKTAEELLSTFLKRYRLNTQAVEEFTAVVRQLEENGKFADALRLISQYVQLPVARESLPQFISEAARLANRLGRYEEGRRYFDELLKTGPDPKTLAMALMDQATACIRRNDLAEAEKWLVYFLNRFPSEPLRADALFKLFDIKVRSKAYATEIILIGTAALEAGPTDPRAVDALIVMARSLEDIGLLSLAQVQYSKISLLNLAGMLEGEKRGDHLSIGEAMLGNARCLYKMGSAVKADHLLRELVNNFEVEPVRSEAVYWWASLALDYRQTVEAMRRLSLAKADEARPEIAAKIQFERNLLEIEAGAQAGETIDRLLQKLSNLPPAEYSDFVRRAYTVYFDKLMNARDTGSMQKLLNAAASGPHARELPLQSYFLRLASLVLADQGPPAFIQCLTENEPLLKRASGWKDGDRQSLLAMVQGIEKTRGEVESFVQGREIGGPL